MRKSNTFLFLLLLILLFPVISVTYSQVSLIARESVWKYLDDGSDQGTAWVSPSFDDGLWAEGPAQLGYGGKGEVTQLSFGDDPNNKYACYYFRHTFNIDADQTTFGDSLDINIHLDDGAVIYLNGKEVLRINMPEGEVTYQTFSAGDAIASSQFLPFKIGTENLVYGPNVLAISVHQMSASSSDIQFDMDLLSSVTPEPLTEFQDSVLIARESVWKYLDDGSDQGSAWKEVRFDDGLWAEGPAQLGYGGKGEVTQLSFGDDPNNKFACYYFRHSFAIEDASVYGDSIGLTIHLDDGTVIYLNGKEVLRVNMPEGEVTYQTFSAGDAIASSQFLPFKIGTEYLVSGKNVLALSVHQMSASSSDIQFDMDLFKTDFLVDIEETEKIIPVEYNILPAYPNPFNPSTNIQFSIPQTGNVKLEIYDQLGELVSTLVNEEIEGGIHTYNWNANGLASGMYLCKITYNNFTKAQKLMLMK